MANLTMSSHVFIMLLSFFTLSFTFLKAQPNEKGVRPFFQILANGTIVRDDAIHVDPVPPQHTPDPITHVMSKDITLDPVRNITARIFLPTLKHSSKKLPILVYFHGGAFCIGSAFARLDHFYLNRVTSKANSVSISINYRLFPEFTLPTAFNDAWFSLQWVASQGQSIASSEPWLARHGDFSRIFLGGDSAGATIVHNLAMRASREELLYDVKVYGAFLAMPYFLGSVRLRQLEPTNVTAIPFYRVWPYVCPNCPHGFDNPAINPEGPRSPSLRRLAVEKIMVYTAELDPLLGRGVRYVAGIRASKWQGILAYFQGKNVSHVFHIMEPEDHETDLLIIRLAEFLQS